MKVEEEGGQKELMLLCRGNCHVFKVILWVGSSRVCAIKSKSSNNYLNDRGYVSRKRTRGKGKVWFEKSYKHI